MNKHKLVWRKYDGTRIENISSYVRDWAIENPFGNIIIGCDSQVHSKYVKYSVSICMHIIDDTGVGHGAHVVFANVMDKRPELRRDFHSKLWAEAEISVQAANEAKAGIEGCDMKIMVHLDYNSDERRFSNSLYSSGVGYVRGMGFEAHGKPDAWAASHTSDALCKNKQGKAVLKF